MTTCPTCGGPCDEHDRQLRFVLPDPVLRTEEQHRAPGAWLSHANPNRAQLMQVPGVGAFVRCLLPVRLTAGYSMTYGLWVAVDPARLQDLYRIWWEPAYRDLVLDGWLANALPGWGLLGAPVRARVRDPDQTPYVEESADPTLTRVLTETWPHEQVIAAASTRHKR